MLHLKAVSNMGPKRLMSTVKSTLEHLKDRALIKVSGNEVSDFLQGLITNDMRHLNSGPGCMYSMFLNTKGRIMYDTIIYRPTENDTYLVECDRSAVSALEKHLKMFRVRRKIQVENLQDDYKVFCIFNNEHLKTDSVNNIEIIESGMPQSLIKIHKNLSIYKDPRLSQLGSRLITRSEIDVENQISDLSLNYSSSNESGKNYKWLRYDLGVGEGVEDLLVGTSFPLECNCDYLHGVSFHKGCYVGQELTARVHHTGMVRKRLMSLNFTKLPTKLPIGENITHRGENLGKYRGHEGDRGLALLRIEKVLKFDEIPIGDGVATVTKPFWWPQEAPKDKMNVQTRTNQ